MLLTPLASFLSSLRQSKAALLPSPPGQPDYRGYHKLHAQPAPSPRALWAAETLRSTGVRPTGLPWVYRDS